MRHQNHPERNVEGLQIPGGEQQSGDDSQRLLLVVGAKSQTIAPTSPAKITAKVAARGSIMPLPIVLATAVPNPKAATKLKNAAQITALPGVSTRVETTVAMELAAS